jgi:glycosyltransferase involved in cell wall biosynthesis
VLPDAPPPQQHVSATRPDGRIPILYLAPWVGYGGTDSATIDWFRLIDRERFAPYLITMQPSTNARLSEVYPYAEEVWALPEFLGGQHMPSFVFDLIHTRGIRLVHVMNARLGFELIADMAALPRPPGVVVQLHVEEPDRSGYVRLVTTRYGNLVDGFSVVSKDLAQAVQGYGVPPERISVIPLGVDSEQLFNPQVVQPIDNLSADDLHILYAGRLTAQKDPLLMVEVMRRVTEKDARAVIHVVGDGELEGEVRERVGAAKLERHFEFHPMTTEMPRWYARCDLVLMTSLFEGVPCVVYEAMAMSTPMVAPGLPGNRELMGETAGVLIEPRDDAAAYAEAVCRLMGNPEERTRLGREGRERVRRDFTLERMADGHAELYERVLSSVEAREGTSARRESLVAVGTNMSSPSVEKPSLEDGAASSPVGSSEPTQLGFANRPSREQPLVSVIVPCFNHGRYLPHCIDSILEQDYGQLEVIVVDDASTEESTLVTLDECERRERVTVLRQTHNRGPSAARNRAIAVASGSYILPVDSDNLLMPGAISSLVEQLQSAGEQVGFIYPNCQYFGTRNDYFQPPSYNPFLLMNGNFCDTCSLIDRAIFDAGITYPQDIVFGHEDWDFALTLASHGVKGEPAREPTLLYRKEGFTRSDAVEYARNSFHENIAERHPDLFGTGDPAARYGRYWAPAVDVKARWAPALSIVLIVPVDLSEEERRMLLVGFERQGCRDFEVVLECPSLPQPSPRTPLRRIPPGLCSSAAARMREGLGMARGRYVLAVGGDIEGMLREVGFVERLLRTMLVRPALEAIAFTDAGEHGHFPYRLLVPGQVSAPAHALMWEVAAQRKLTSKLRLEEGLEVESLVRAMSVNAVHLQWRHSSISDASWTSGGNVVSMSSRQPTPSSRIWLELDDAGSQLDPHLVREREKIREAEPAIPALPWNAVRRWLGLASWIPPETELLTRHREIGGERRILGWGNESPRGFQPEFHLGAIQRFAPPGTVRLVQDPQGVPDIVPRDSPRNGSLEELGHLEQAGFPLLNAVERAVLPDGSVTLVSTDRDPVRSIATHLEQVGHIEGYPNEPVWPADARLPGHGQVGLQRCLDLRARRHFYRVTSVGETDDGGLVGELGALHLTEELGSIPVWIDPAGRLVTDRYRPDTSLPRAAQLVRWTAAPARWRDFGRVQGRARAILRRGIEAVAIGIASRRVADCSGVSGFSVAQVPVGYLYSAAGPRRRELLAAIHPVTGDQLLTFHRLEAADMGYGPAVGLGYVLIDTLTGGVAMRRVAVPWASRFGLEVRRG